MKPLLLLFLIAAGALTLRADDSAVPGSGYPASRYQDLWEKSPFAVETPEAAPDSPDYALYGIAFIDGVSYASVVDKKTQEHFLVSSDKPSDGLMLNSVNHGTNASDTSVVISKDGQLMTLKLELASAGAGGSPMPGGVPMNPPPVPIPNTNPQIPMPGTNATEQFRKPMFPRYRRPQIHLPPPPNGAPGQQPGQPPANP